MKHSRVLAALLLASLTIVAVSEVALRSRIHQLETRRAARAVELTQRTTIRREVAALQHQREQIRTRIELIHRLKRGQPAGHEENLRVVALLDALPDVILDSAELPAPGRMRLHGRGATEGKIRSSVEAALGGPRLPVSDAAPRSAFELTSFDAIDRCRDSDLPEPMCVGFTVEVRRR